MNDNINTTLYNIVVKFLKLVDTEGEDFYNRNIELINEAIDVMQEIDSTEMN